MGEIVDLKDKIRKYYKFTKSEITGMVFSIIIIAFIISFKDWGTNVFNPRVGLYNFFNSILIVALAFLVHDAGQRILGFFIGFRIEYQTWTYGLVFALFLAFVSNGNLWLIIPGGFIVHHMPGHRLGFFRYDINTWGLAMIALAGPLSIILLTVFLKVLSVFAMPNMLLQNAIFFNALYAMFIMIPIPPLDGSKIYFGSRMLYSFSLPFIIATSFLLITQIRVMLVLILSFLLAIILWITYYTTFEKNVWFGSR